jgi:ribosome-associated toxin RatA of RatAB toxin-antitoxin module
MASVSRRLIVSHSAEAMFSLIDGVESYPEYLPWCREVRVFERTPALTHARLALHVRGVRTEVTTRNRNEPPEWIRLELVDGPFRHFTGHWHIRPLGQEGCSIEFAADYAFASRMTELLIAPAFGSLVEGLVDRFVERADALRAAARP